MHRFLLIVATLAAGCEQLKSPQRIHDLEDKVEKLSAEVAELKGHGAPGGGKAGAGSGAGAKAGAGSAEVAAGSGDGSAEGAKHEGSGEAVAAGEAKAKPEAAGEHAAEGAGAGAGSGSNTASAKPAEGAEPSKPAGSEQAVAGPPPPPPDAAMDPAERALAQLRDVVAQAQRSGKPGKAEEAQPAAPGLGMPSWSYQGKNGPPAWGTLDPGWKSCGEGKAQSPVDIAPRPGAARPIEFDYKPVAGTLVDDGHMLKVNFAAGSTIRIDGATYQLVQLHVHAPSEHTIAGEHYPLELQLVHQDGEGHLAIVSVLYDSGAASSPLGEIWARWSRKTGGEDRLKKPFDPKGLLPDTRTVFRYTGSLTFPPCAEGVIWNVMRRTLTDSKPHLDAFARRYPHNIRPVQPLNERKIE